MGLEAAELIDGVRRGDLRSVARAITLAENGAARGREVLERLFEHTGSAQVVGVTGAPGAGKSTLVDRLALHWRAAGQRVAVLAIDPTSPFSGGAILGDRIRMSRTTADPEVYIRSMGTRGSLGGLSRAAFDAIQVLDAAGFDLILLETVGVGQGEVDVVRTADTCLVLLVPGMGDGVQAIKAGILEIADVFVVNKSDREGADALERDLRVLISLSEPQEGAWRTPIVRTVATDGQGIEGATDSVAEHRVWLDASQQGQSRRRGNMRQRIVDLTRDRVFEMVLQRGSAELDRLAERCCERSLTPWAAVTELLSDLRISSESLAVEQRRPAS